MTPDGLSNAPTGPRRRRLAMPHYLAVLELRRQGHRVYCARRNEAGRETHHELDGTIMPTALMIGLAREQRKPKEAAYG